MDWSDYSIHGHFEELVALFESSFSRLYALISSTTSNETCLITRVAHLPLVPENEEDIKIQRKQIPFYITLCDLCSESIGSESIGVSSRRSGSGLSLSSLTTFKTKMSARISLLGCGTYSRDPLCSLPTWFGEPKFLLIRSALSIDDPTTGRIEIQETISKRVLAAATIALSNVREQGLGRNLEEEYFNRIPIFVQVHSIARRCFIGRIVCKDYVTEFATDGKHIRSRWSAEPPPHFGEGVCIGIPWHLSTLEAVIRNFAGRITISTPKAKYPSSSSFSGAPLPLSTLASNLRLSVSISLNYRVLPNVSNIRLLNLPVVSTLEVEAAWFAPHTSFGSINRLPVSAEGATPSQLLAAQVLSVRIHWAENTSVTRTNALRKGLSKSNNVSKSLVNVLLSSEMKPAIIKNKDVEETVHQYDTTSNTQSSVMSLKYLPLNVLLSSTLRTRQLFTDSSSGGVAPLPVAACPIASKIAVLAFALSASYALFSETRENEVEEIEWKRRIESQARSRPPSASPGFVATSASLNSYDSSDDDIIEDDDNDIVESVIYDKVKSSRSPMATPQRVKKGKLNSKQNRRQLKRILYEAKAAAFYGEPVAFDFGAEDLAQLADVERKYSIDLMTTQSTLRSPSMSQSFSAMSSPSFSPNETNSYPLATSKTSTSSSTSFSIARRLLKSVSSAQVLLGGARAVAGLAHDPARFIALSDVHYAVKSAINATLYTNSSSIEETNNIQTRFSILTSRLCANVLTASLPSVRLAQARESNLTLAAHYNGESTSGVTPMKAPTTTSSSSVPPPPSPDMFGLTSRFPGGLIEWASTLGDGDDSETEQRMIILRNLTLRTVCICWASLIKELRSHWLEARSGISITSTTNDVSNIHFAPNDALNILTQSIKTLLLLKKSNHSDSIIESETLLKGDAALLILERMGIIALSTLLLRAASTTLVDQISESVNKLSISTDMKRINEESTQSFTSPSELFSQIYITGLPALGGRVRGVAAHLEELDEALALDSQTCEQSRLLLESGFAFQLSPKTRLTEDVFKTINSNTMINLDVKNMGISPSILNAAIASRASQTAVKTSMSALSDAACLLIATCADLETQTQRIQWLRSCFPDSLVLALSDGLSVEYHHDSSETNSCSTLIGISRHAPFSETIHSLIDGRLVTSTSSKMNVIEGGGAARQGRYHDGTEHSLLIVAETVEEKKALVALLNASHPSDGGGVERLPSDEACFLLESSLPRYIDSESTDILDNESTKHNLTEEILHRAVIRVDAIGARVSMKLSETL